MKNVLIALAAAASAAAVLSVVARVSMAFFPEPRTPAVFDALEAASRLHFYASFPITAALIGVFVGFLARSAVAVTAVCGVAPVLFLALAGASSTVEWSLTFGYAVLAAVVASLVARRRARHAPSPPSA